MNGRTFIFVMLLAFPTLSVAAAIPRDECGRERPPQTLRSL